MESLFFIYFNQQFWPKKTQKSYLAQLIPKNTWGLGTGLMVIFSSHIPISSHILDQFGLGSESCLIQALEIGKIWIFTEILQNTKDLAPLSCAVNTQKYLGSRDRFNGYFFISYTYLITYFGSIWTGKWIMPYSGPRNRQNLKYYWNIAKYKGFDA